MHTMREHRPVGGQAELLIDAKIVAAIGKQPPHNGDLFMVFRQMGVQPHTGIFAQQPPRQPGGPGVLAVATEQVLELLASHPLPLPKAPVEGYERSPESVLLLVHLLCKA